MTAINYKAEGIVSNIQRFSVNDGPGIRTIVFLKGCPLSCKWCSNPETQPRRPVILFDKDKCIGCGKCTAVCAQHAASLDNPARIDRTKCIGSGECASVCPTGALSLNGETMTVEQLISELKKDAIMYRESGGGITLSGGEPLVQWQFATELLKACKAQGWHTAVETTAYGSAEAVEAFFPYIDVALMDVKSMDTRKHKAATGVSPEIIWKNAKRIAELCQIVVRVPTIPGVNATAEDFQKICDFAKTLHGVDTIHVLPYHRLGVKKYELLNRPYPMGHELTSMAREAAEPFKQVVEQNGFNCVIGG